MFTLTYTDCLPHKNRFEARIDRSGGPESCHPHTTNSETTDGYGLMGMRVGDTYKQVRLHRFAYVLATGENLDSHEYIDHVVCNNPRCANRAHLRKTDARGNAQTRMLSARWAGRVGRRVFTDDEVITYRRRWAAGESLASLTHGSGVRASSIHDLVHGKNYKQLPVYFRPAGWRPYSPQRRLTEQQVAVIKARLLAGESRAALAREYGVTRGQIGRIARRERWQDVAPAALEPALSVAAD